MTRRTTREGQGEILDSRRREDTSPLSLSNELAIQMGSSIQKESELIRNCCLRGIGGGRAGLRFQAG